MNWLKFMVVLVGSFVLLLFPTFRLPVFNLWTRGEFFVNQVWEPVGGRFKACGNPWDNGHFSTSKCFCVDQVWEPLGGRFSTSPRVV